MEKPAAKRQKTGEDNTNGAVLVAEPISLIRVLAGCGDNNDQRNMAVLKCVNGFLDPDSLYQWGRVVLNPVGRFLDPYSLYQWGRAIIRVERGLTTNTNTNDTGTTSLAHDIGMAILQQTVLPEQGYVPCSDLGEMFLDTEEDENVYGEDPKAVEGPFRSIAWKRRHELVNRIFSLEYATEKKDRMGIERSIPDWFKDPLLEGFNAMQQDLLYTMVFALMERVLILIHESQYRKICVMEDILAAARLLNVHFSAPLEPFLDMKTFQNVRVTMRDLACMDAQLCDHRIDCTEQTPEYEMVHDEYGEDEKEEAFGNGIAWASMRYSLLVNEEYSHKDLVQEVDEIIAKHIEILPGLLRGGEEEFLGYIPVPKDCPDIMDDDETWDDWVTVAFHQSGDPDKYKQHFIDEFGEYLRGLKAFLREKPYQSTRSTRRGTKLLTNPKPFMMACPDIAYDVRRCGHYNPFEFTGPAMELAQKVVEDVAFGVAVKPFLVKRPDYDAPTLCHLIIGKHHGTTMVSFDPWVNVNAGADGEGQENDSEDSDYCPSEIDEDDVVSTEVPLRRSQREK